MIGSKQNIVGQFFEALALNLLGGERPNEGCGDVHIWGQETLVEVKSSGDPSSYGFRLMLSQIDEYQIILKAGFPFRRVWYSFFAYSNGRLPTLDGSRRTMLSQYTDSASVQEYLSRSVKWGLVVDFEVVRRWQETLRHSSMSILGHPGMKTVDIYHKRIQRFLNGDARAAITELGLDPSVYRSIARVVVGRVRTATGTYKSSFPLTVLLPRDEMRTARAVLGPRLRGKEKRL